MKKIMYLIFTAAVIAGTSAFANPAIDAGSMMNLINSPMGLGGSQVHDMKMIDDMKFRYQEYNDYKEVQENKDAKKTEEFKLTEPAMQRIYNNQPKQNVQFVEQNGQIKIQSIE